MAGGFGVLLRKLTVFTGVNSATCCRKARYRFNRPHPLHPTLSPFALCVATNAIPTQRQIIKPQVPSKTLKANL
ncbi:hypothetical protein L596_003121 [Steinernema carpocapsae]|uniref:Uncharacterized protein n=1 Tax=Steinernema carpocapsae TaxID=34508 RepID=A0A4U8US77_STECR|nr:hypothetical protein L596_003121 [Steinernema carpocapsae]